MKCEHESVIYGDDDERGVCEDCGATCDWHWVKDFDDLLGKTIEVREVVEWHSS